MRKLIASLLLFGCCASVNGAPTQYIQLRNTLQSGATFYVSSGTVSGPLTANTLNVSSNTVLPGTTFYQSGLAVARFSSATVQNLVGNFGNAACVGCFGQVISSASAVDAIPLTSAQVFDVVTLSVPPGCWLLIGTPVTDGTGVLGTANACVIGAISTTSGNTLAGTTYGINKNTGAPQATGSAGPGTMIIWPQCVTTTTNYYLKIDATFTGGTSFGLGALQAIRIN